MKPIFIPKIAIISMEFLNEYTNRHKGDCIFMTEEQGEIYKSILMKDLFLTDNAFAGPHFFRDYQIYIYRPL